MWALLLSEELLDGHGLVRCPREMTNETVTDSIDVRMLEDMKLIDVSGLGGAICTRL
jgi:hypothetical protein